MGGVLAWPAATGEPAVDGAAGAPTHTTVVATRALPPTAAVSTAPAATRVVDAVHDVRPGPAPAPARVVDPPRPRPPDTPPRGGLPRRVPRLRPAQLVCWQLALVAPLAALGHGRAVLVLVGAAAVLLLAVTTGWSDGRWWYRWAWLAITFAVRSRPRHVLPGRLLAALAPGTRVVPLSIGDVDAAAVHSRGGVATVLLVAGDTVPPAISLLPGDRDVGYAAQTITHLVPGEPARCWLVLQARPDAGFPDVTADLANATRRLVRRLERAGVPAVPAGAEDVELMICTLLGVAPDVEVTTRERWTGCHAGGRTHVSAIVPAGSSLPTGAAVTAPTTVVTTATSPTAVRTVVRVATTDPAAAAVSLSAWPGAEPLPGRQLPGIRASLPLGAALDIR